MDPDTNGTLLSLSLTEYYGRRECGSSGRDLIGGSRRGKEIIGGGSKHRCEMCCLRGGHSVPLCTHFAVA
jgi:hypothetical protein